MTRGCLVNNPKTALDEAEEIRARSEAWFKDYQETGRVLQRDLRVTAELAEISDKKAD